jgi:hypothetical protein
MMVQPDQSAQLVEKYREILAGRGRRYSCDSVFGGRKREFEKALLERLGEERDARQGAALVEMYAQLSSFVPDQDVELVELCAKRGTQDKDFQAVLDLIETGDHEAIQKQIEAKNVPELKRYYALHRRVQIESQARRQQAQSVVSLGGDQPEPGAPTDA